MKSLRRVVLSTAAAALLFGAVTAEAQLSLQWMVPAAANVAGLNGTVWHTDLSLHNPQAHDLPVVIQFLPSGTDNRQAETLSLTLYPWETYNLWDVLGPSGFARGGTGAILVFADWSLACDPVEECDFLATSRTYTLDPRGGAGEFGQTIPGAGTWQGVDWGTLGYAAGILNDGERFRTNIGVASWTDGPTTVAVDVQNADGEIVDRVRLQLPPYGHIQRRLEAPVEGGALVFWIEDGPPDVLVFGYASVVDEITGDSSFQLAEPSVVGFAAGKTSAGRAARRPVPVAEPRRPDPGLGDRPTARPRG
ncbi:MAG: hypothetical protein MUC56_03610 [Thermoanaerobaculales bacterium]|jgi:hypothetical protein|nr:hypothetical protein [Thermoanaerobaculales bacterium]